VRAQARAKSTLNRRTIPEPERLLHVVFDWLVMRQSPSDTEEPMRMLCRLAILLIATGFAPLGAHALTIGMIDTFQSDIGGWFAGGGPFGAFPPVPPHVVPTGGPTGANDAFLQVTSQGGAGAGSRLVAMNASQWAGDYLAAGFATIEMDLRNFGTSDLVIRLLIEDPLAGPPTNIAVSNFGALLPAGGDWVHIVFPVAIGAFTALMGDVGSVLSNTTLLRIIHAPDVGFASPVAGLLGIDNISAGPVPRPGPFAAPEPSSMLLAAAGLLVLGFGRWRSRSVTRSSDQRGVQVR
jgi:hypothetical protein